MACLGDSLPPNWWREAQYLQSELDAHGNYEAVRLAHPDNSASPRAMAEWWRRHDLPTRHRGARGVVVESGSSDDWLLVALKRLGDDATVEALADAADVSPRRVREAAERLNIAGFRLAHDDARVALERIAPQRDHLHQALFDGDRLRVGLVSDTHLAAKEEALSELHLAYDVFVDEGIAEVWHAGDLVTGKGIFRGQEAEVKFVTLDDQIAYAAEHYPQRDGIKTRIIGGNHDLEGEAGRVGLDVVRAVANQRDDFDYLGPFSAWFETPQGAWVHLLHGRGGMSYSFSYKAQKLVDGYPGGRKPAVLCVGHWHVRGNFEARAVEVVFPGCFEWQSRFMARLGLNPAVGFHILDMTFGDDGSLVQFQPRWYRFYEGRVVG